MSGSFWGDSSKRLIVWMLCLLVIFFIAGMWVLSTLNLSYSEAAIAEVRQKEIEETFFNNLSNIKQIQDTLEQYTSDLARLGSLFAVRYQSQQPQAQMDAQLQLTLQEKFQDVAAISAIGIWLDPDKISPHNQPIAHYVYQDATGEAQFLTVNNAQLAPMRQQQWYILAQAARSENQRQGQTKNIFWTPAYFNQNTDSAVITLVKPIIDIDQQIIGYVSTDWQAERIIDLVSQVSITPNTFALLIDKNKRKLSSLSRLNNELYAQKIIDSVMRQDFIDPASRHPPLLRSAFRQKAQLQTHQFTVDSADYVLYSATTPAQMLFAVGVPKNEIDAVIAPMRAINLQILLLTGMVMLVLSAYLLWRITSLMRELQASYMDQLTTLPNRPRLLLDLKRHQNSMLILVNVDRFRELNSIFGNQCGDAVLQRLGKNIAEFCRTHYETGTAKLYRLSGDEFVLHGQGWSKEFLLEFLQKISDFLQDQHLQWQDQLISLTATMGAAEQADSEAENSPDILLSHATAALKTARERARNYEIYYAEQDVESLYEQNLFWARQLKQALQTDQIFPWFQPIVDNHSGRITKYECLIRMLDTEGKVISPGVFLPVANKLRLDSLLTRVMVEKSCQKFVNLPYDFSINLSYRDLLDSDVTAFIFDTLTTYQVGNRLIFEILESDGIENYHEVSQFIVKAKTFGCKIAIDDFGSGYSNFEHLLRLNVDLIKIDGSLIKNLNEDASSMMVTRGVVEFARSLGIKTVAEFVHCESVQKQVQALGIDFSQGAYFSMPQAKLIVQ